SQNTAAFNAAIAEAAANAGSSSTGRGVVELVQNKTYTVATTNGSINNQNAALPLLSNVEIRTVGAPTRLSGNQATIQFASWAGKSGVHNQAIFRIDSGVNNVLTGWLTLHGNKNTLDDETDVNYSQGQDGGIHNVVIYGGTNITFREVFSTHALNDALYLRTSSDPNLLIEDCTFTRCRRQGISITRLGTSGAGIDQMVCRRLLVSDIGDFPGDIGGHRPGGGIDLEPNADPEEGDGLTMPD